MHTWPEHRYAAIDFFSCSDSIDIDIAVEYLKGIFQPEDVKINLLKRGIIDSKE